MKKAFITGILIFFLFPGLKGETGERNHAVPLFLSLAFPGGGQLYNGRYLKAGIYAALEGVFIYGALKQHKRMEDARDDLAYYKDIGDPAKIAEYEFYVETYRNDRNNFIWMTAAAVLLSAGDAYVDSRFKSFKRDVFKKGDEVSVSAWCRGITLSYNW